MMAHLQGYRGIDIGSQRSCRYSEIPEEKVAKGEPRPIPEGSDRACGL